MYVTNLQFSLELNKTNSTILLYWVSLTTNTLFYVYIAVIFCTMSIMYKLYTLFKFRFQQMTFVINPGYIFNDGILIQYM